MYVNRVVSVTVVFKWFTGPEQLPANAADGFATMIPFTNKRLMQTVTIYMRGKPSSVALKAQALMHK